MHILDGLTFDDLLLIPKYSEISSRNMVDLSVNISGLKFSHPIIPANMKTITGKRMAEAVYNSGGLAILHRFMDIEEQLNIIKEFAEIDSQREYYVTNDSLIAKDSLLSHVGISVGIKEEDKENIKKFIELGIKIICVDIAHANSLGAVEMVRYIKNNYPDILLIAGNVATFGGAYRLFEAGADIVKAGVGNGALCTTRIETGAGVPQMTALDDCYSAKLSFQEETGKKVYLISDGGISNIGSIVKALCFADMVMMGNMFAGCEETPGPILQQNGIMYKEYVGSSTHKSSHIEGVKALVNIKGSFSSILEKIKDGLTSGCSYQGCDNLEKLKDNPKFVKITNNGLIESYPHDVITIS
jgi:IMP dehydrogenase